MTSWLTLTRATAATPATPTDRPLIPSGAPQPSVDHSPCCPPAPPPQTQFSPGIYSCACGWVSLTLLPHALPPAPVPQSFCTTSSPTSSHDLPLPPQPSSSLYLQVVISAWPYQLFSTLYSCTQAGLPYPLRGPDPYPKTQPPQQGPPSQPSLPAHPYLRAQQMVGSGQPYHMGTTQPLSPLPADGRGQPRHEGPGPGCVAGCR